MALVEDGAYARSLTRRFGVVAYIRRHLTATAAAGLLVTIPLVVTFLIFRAIIGWFDPVMKPVVESLFGEGNYRSGMGIGAFIVLIYLTGLLTHFVVGRRIIDLSHRVMGAVPVVKTVYGPLLQASGLLSNSTSEQNYGSVVWVDYWRTGIKSLGIVTSRVLGTNAQPVLTVYVPTGPIPNSGFLMIVPEDQAIPADFTVEEATKLIVSMGILAPDRMLRRSEGQLSETGASNQ